MAIDRTSRFAVTQLTDKPVLSGVDAGIRLAEQPSSRAAEQPRNRNTAWSRPMRFDMICEANDVEHRLAMPNHPCTNGQVERTNRTIKEAAVNAFTTTTEISYRPTSPTS